MQDSIYANGDGKIEVHVLTLTEKSEALALMRAQYESPRPELNFTSPFELLIATMLSAQCTDKQVNKTTAELFLRYNTPEAFAKLTGEALCPLIKGCGLYKTKASHIIAACNILMERYNGEVPKDRDALMTLPGVGRKTANVVLSNAFGIPAIAVDTHVFRVANRIGFAQAKDVLTVERQLMDFIPQEEWGDAHHYLIFHGRRVCHARNPACKICFLSALCTYNNQESVNK